MSKYTIFALITILGIGCTAFGAWAKIMHLSFANSFLAIGLCSKAIGLSALAWFLFKTVGKKN